MSSYIACLKVNTTLMVMTCSNRMQGSITFIMKSYMHLRHLLLKHRYCKILWCPLYYIVIFSEFTLK